MGEDGRYRGIKSKTARHKQFAGEKLRTDTMVSTLNVHFCTSCLAGEPKVASSVDRCRLLHDITVRASEKLILRSHASLFFSYSLEHGFEATRYGSLQNKHGTYSFTHNNLMRSAQLPEHHHNWLNFRNNFNQPRIMNKNQPGSSNLLRPFTYPSSQIK